MVQLTNIKHKEYFESILQIRDATDEVIDFVTEEIPRIGLMVAKVKKVKNGFDYYLSDNSLTKALGRKLQEKFGGQYLITASLHTKKRDEELYRLTVLFRQAHFQKGDVVIFKGDEYSVKAIGKEIFLQESRTGKKMHLKYNDLGLIKRKD